MNPGSAARRVAQQVGRVRHRLVPARRVLAGAAGRLTTWGDPGEGSAPTGAADQDRLAAALQIVAQVEASADVLPELAAPVRFWGRGRVVRRPQVSPAVEGLVPRPDRQGWQDDAEVRELWSPTAADVVVMAKFDVHERTKLRAAYGEKGLTVAVQPRSPSGVDGIARIVRAHEVVSQHAPWLMAAVLGHGQLPGGLPFVVERWLQGQTLGSAAELSQGAPAILDALSTVHRGHGVTPVRISDHWAPLAGRWDQTRASGLVPEELGRWVAELVARDGTLRHSWVHGDLVASNVLRTEDRLVLIDWEHSQEAPIMNDAAKLHLFAADTEDTLVTVLDAFGGAGGGAEAYSPAEELALAHAQLISHYPRRSAQLVGHPRAGIYDRQVRRQLERLAQVKAAV